MRIGLLTGGGDCPGLNAAIRAVVRTADAEGDEVIGFHHGWRGVVDGEGSVLTPRDTRGILQSGGTVLGTARYHPDEQEGGLAGVRRTVRSDRLDTLVVLGGDGTLGASVIVAETGIAVIGVPKTIDNDVRGTERCIGFDTAVGTASEAIDRVHTTAESHDRLMVVEVMGRSAGWLAVHAGVAAGADVICVPEDPVPAADLAEALRRRHDAGATSSVVVVAEGAVVDGLSPTAAPATSIGALLARELEATTGFETRLTVLGHIQRGGTPSAGDRWLATQLGIEAVDAARAGCGRTLVALDADRPVRRPLDVVAGGPRLVPPQVLAMARRLTVELDGRAALGDREQPAATARA